jgi:hypothetical protein
VLPQTFVVFGTPRAHSGFQRHQVENTGGAACSRLLTPFPQAREQRLTRIKKSILPEEP